MLYTLILTALPAIALALNTKEFVCALNSARRADGRPAVGLATELLISSTRHAKDMARTRQVSTTGSDGSNPGQRMQEAGFKWNSYREIVAYNYKDDANLFNTLYNIPKFKSDLLSTDVQNVGIAVAYSSSNEPYYTVDLGRDNKGVRTVQC